MEQKFWEILEEKVRGGRELPPQSPSMETREIPGFSWLMGHAPRREFSDLNYAFNRYGVSRSAARPKRLGSPSAGSSEKTRMSSAQTDAHVLTSQQKESLAYLQRFARSLSNCFDLNELKQAWRAAALATHPDTGGSNEAFRRALTAYKALKPLVNE